MTGKTSSTIDKLNGKNESQKQGLNLKLILGALTFSVVAIILSTTDAIGYANILLQSVDDDSLCPLNEVIAPPQFFKDNSTVLTILNDADFRNNSAKKLSGSVQVDTTVFDNFPDVTEDITPWVNFAKFHEYLKLTFPTVFEAVEVDYVNTYGLVLHWKGSNSNLKPLMLAAHQDVVPVQNGTLNDWHHPPFDGHYDGTFVYGRGSVDCKNVLIGIMETLELLVKDDFKPQRSIVAAFGFDEEISGYFGAAKMSKFLEAKFGKDSFYALIDEGPGLIPNPLTKQIIGFVGTGEKGYLDVKVTLRTRGGHSSVPPEHTNIGILSQLVNEIEADTFEPQLTSDNPILKLLQCLAINSDKLPTLQRKAILRAAYDKVANAKVVQFLLKNRMTRYLIETSQAIDIFHGGEKINALPEFSEVDINHRIAIESSTDEVKQRFKERALRVAQRNEVGLVLFGKTIIPETKNGVFEIEVFGHSVEPAPVSPFNDNIWKYLSGTVRHVFEDLVFPKLPYPIITAPGIMTANTDTRHYWNLSKHIFRFTPQMFGDLGKENNIHSVDEKIRIESHLQFIAFFYEYIQAIDTPDAE